MKQQHYKQPTLYPSVHTGLNQHYQHVSLSIFRHQPSRKAALVSSFRETCREESGSGANSECLSPILSPSSNNNNFPCPACEDKSVDIVRLLFWRLDHLQQEMAIAVACLRPGATKQRSQARDQGGEMIQMGNRGKQGWGMGSRLSLMYKVWS